MTSDEGKKEKLVSSIGHLSDEEKAILMPEWKSTQPNDDQYMLKAEGLTPAPTTNDGQNLVAMVPDGIRAVEASAPHSPYEWWITDAGNVSPLVVKT
ncbi:MAG: hypothetical protein ACTSX8_08465, partial [Alphaproteobacteria bacterium]